MNRTFGFFLGSAVVFALLVLVLGQPVPLAPPADPDRLPGSGTSGTTAVARMPQPGLDAASQRSPRSSAPPSPESAAPSPLPPALPAPDATSPSALQPEPDTGTDPARIEDPDENELVEAWLASSARPSADDNVAGSAGTDGQAPTAAGSGAARAESEVPETGWFPLWDPFHSELSANAFARRLERVTGLDYRVIRTGPAEYRVTVGYTSEEQRIANLDLIEEATGLTLSGGSL